MLVRKSRLRAAERIEARLGAQLLETQGDLIATREEMRAIAGRVIDQEGLLGRIAELTEDLERTRVHADMSAERATLVEKELSERKSNHLENITQRMLIVHTKDAGSMEGILFAVYADTVVLRNARYLDPVNQENIIDLSGDQVIPRGNIEWIQQPEVLGVE